MGSPFEKIASIGARKSAFAGSMGDTSISAHSTMGHIISHKDWLFCTNSFRYDSPDRPGLFVEDRGFSAQSYVDAITNSNRTNSHLALNLSMPLKNTLCSHPHQATPNQDHVSPVRNYIDHMLKEIRLISELIPKQRSVNYLHWQGDIAQLLSTAEMTEVMYSLNKAFSFQPEQEGTFVIELEKAPADDAIIALIKGLGFTHICLGTQNDGQKPIDFEFLAAQVDLFKQYKFKSVNVRFLVGAHESCKALKEKLNRLIHINPDTIYLIDEDERQSVFSGVETEDRTHCNCHEKFEKTLVESGYEKLNHVKFSKNKTASKGVSGDLIGIGLGATSLIENAFAHNVEQLDLYYQSLQQDRLPFGYGGYIRPKS